VLVRRVHRGVSAGGVRPHYGRPFGVVLGLLVLTIPSGACARPNDAGPRLEVTWKLRPETPSVGPTTLTVTLRDTAGAPVEGARVRLEGHMTHAGMAPVLANASERAPGVYDLPFAFTMQGDWVLLVSAVLKDGARVEQRIDVAGVRPSG
jgi:YtkA-like